MNGEIDSLLEQVYSRPVGIKHSSSVGGGCINQTQVLHLSNGERVFLKYNSHPPQGFFEAEARGLGLMAKAKNGPRVPHVLGLHPASNAHFILLEYVEECSPAAGFHEQFARALAELHRTTQDRYGLDHDNFIGKTVQRNTLESDGLVFFRDHRIRFQQELARTSGLLPQGPDSRLDRLCDKLEQLLNLTGEKPALSHGDLWSGNYFADDHQNPCIFDPAAHYGLREADLAMTELFGRLPQAFYDAYHEAFPLNPGYEERKALYDLYHLLNHLNLFGRSYLSSVEETINRFV